ncbi:MAG: aconitase family protein, partial [Rubrivivax sp.]|nr:aconitase family protein [Rubrivivax sp.]
SFGIGATEMASVWALGYALNIEVPATIKVVVKGEFQPQVGPKDLILHLIGRLTAQGANFKVLEFHGDAAAPEGALYVNGQLVGHLLGVNRL